MRYLCLSISLLLLEFSLFGQNIEFRSNVTYNQLISDIWGWSDGEREYAIVGFERGFSIVDVTDPDNPEKLFTESGPRTIWRDIKTWGNYAYGIHENTGSSGKGLAIMDMSQLPEAFEVTYWQNDGSLDEPYRSSHNIFIDEKGFAYIVGGNEITGGVMILDLNNDPLNPTVAGMYRERYVHDCFVRNDTLWTGEVYNGEFGVIDVSDKTNPVVLARQETPFEFTHNIWVSDDGKTAFTTDETGGAPVAAYDVSDLSDIHLIDEFKSGSGVIPHNSHVFNDFVVVSYYRDGVIIVDATLPDEMVMTGSYDTSPDYEGDGFNGCWGVYPYLPSGNIIATDIENGLFVLSPNYVKAFHIRGTVRDASTGAVIPQAELRIDGNLAYTDFDGFFKKGYAEGRSVTLSATKEGYELAELTVEGDNGDIIDLNIELDRLITSINNSFDEGDLKLLNNPVSDQLILRNSINVRAPMNLKVHDTNGQLIVQESNIESSSSISLNVDHLSRGLYILSVEAGNELLGFTKFVKE